MYNQCNVWNISPDSGITFFNLKYSKIINIFQHFQENAVNKKEIKCLFLPHCYLIFKPILFKSLFKDWPHMPD